MNTKEEIVAKLKSAREERGLSKNQLAKAVGVNQATICRFENHGETSLDTFLKILQYLGISLEEAISKTGNIDPKGEQRKILNALLLLLEYRILISKDDTDIFGNFPSGIAEFVIQNNKGVDCVTLIKSLWTMVVTGKEGEAQKFINALCE